MLIESWDFQKCDCKTEQSCPEIILCFAVKPLYLNLSTLHSSSLEAIQYDVMFASAISYFYGSDEPSTPSLEAADQPHFCHTHFLFTLNKLPTNTLTHLQCVNVAKTVKNESIKKGFIHFWQTLFWLFSLSGPCVSFGQPRCVRGHYYTLLTISLCVQMCFMVDVCGLCTVRYVCKKWFMVCQVRRIFLTGG